MCSAAHGNSEFMHESSRLTFRPLELSDLDWLSSLENNPEHWFTGDRQVPYSKYILEQYLLNAKETLAEAGQFRWLIERKEDGQPIGLLDLFNYSDRHQRASVGVLIELQFRNSGYGKEALMWLSEYSADVAHLHQLYAEVTSDNAPSVELFKSAGYNESGVLVDWIRRKDGFVDMIQMQHML